MDFRIAYLGSGAKLNQNFFSNMGVMTFNKGYIALVFWSKCVNLAVLALFFAFFWNGIKQIAYEKLCIEQKYVK
jgi:hypothetical protein